MMLAGEREYWRDDGTTLDAPRTALCVMPGGRDSAAVPRALATGIGVKHVRGGARHELRPVEGMLHIVLPMTGRLAVAGALGVEQLCIGEALMLGQIETIELMGQEDSSLLLIDISRAAIQAEAFARWGVPRRVGRANLVFACTDARTPFSRAMLCLSTAQIFQFRDGDKARAGIQDEIAAALAEQLRERSGSDAIFPVATSVRRALDRLAVLGPEPVEVDDVVRASGVIHLTLRRAVKETTGIALTKLLQDARLDWARIRLESDQESRSLGALAEALGLRSPALSRAYQRRFGETPTQTRTRAFQTAR